MSGSDDYDVGYKKPPVSTRFGEPDGNSRGRGRKSRNLKTDLTEELGKRVTVKINGKLHRMTQQQALIRALILAGMKGSDRAGSRVLELALRVLGPGEEVTPVVGLSAEDEAILASFMERQE